MQLQKVRKGTHSALTAHEAIFERSSVRKYTGARLSEDALNELLAAAVRAPTAMHEEPWQFVVVQDPATLKRLSDVAKRLFTAELVRLHPERAARNPFAQPEFNVFYDAGTLIVICAKTAGPFVTADCWLAAENLILTAQAMGFGSCVIGSAVSALNLPEIKRELGIPATSTAVAPIIVGTAKGAWPATARKPPEVVARR